MGYLKFNLIICIFLLTGCTNSNFSKLESKSNFVQCYIENDAGTLSCGEVPLTIYTDINEKFKSSCLINVAELDRDEKLCLEKNKKNPVDAYLLGELIYKDSSFDGLKLIEYSAQNKYPQALVWLAKYYEKKGDYDNYEKFIKKAVELGSPLAMHSLGAHYMRGIGIKKDEQLGSELLNLSKDYISASYSELALDYLNKGNYKKFLEYNQIALSKEYWFALSDLALFYLGDIPSYQNYKDLSKARSLIEELVDKNIGIGYALKARLLEIENGTNSSIQICGLQKQAFDGGHKPSGLNYALDLVQGYSCTEDYVQAIKIFTDIYDNEEGELKIIAASNLGYMYLNGLGSLTDIPKAKRYLKYASDYSYQPAIEMLNNIK